MLDTTQENLETVVGTAFSGWSGFKVRYLNPTINWLCSSCCCCICGRSLNSNIYFDMYDEDEREALEQLLQAEDGGDIYDYDSDGDDFGEYIGAAERSSTSWWQSITDWIGTPSTILGQRGQQSILRYRPSNAGLTGLNTRERSSTGNSTHSSDTYRSRGDLFGSEDIENDAQMMDDSFVQDLPSGDGQARTMEASSSGAIDKADDTKLKAELVETELHQP